MSCAALTVLEVYMCILKTWQRLISCTKTQKNLHCGNLSYYPYRQTSGLQLSFLFLFFVWLTYHWLSSEIFATGISLAWNFVSYQVPLLADCGSHKEVSVHLLHGQNLGCLFSLTLIRNLNEEYYYVPCSHTNSMVPLLSLRKSNRSWIFSAEFFHTLLPLPPRSLGVCGMQWDLQAFMSILGSEKKLCINDPSSLPQEWISAVCSKMWQAFELLGDFSWCRRWQVFSVDWENTLYWCSVFCNGS